MRARRDGAGTTGGRSANAPAPTVSACVVAYAPRDTGPAGGAGTGLGSAGARAASRAVIRGAFPRRRARLVVVRSAEEFERAFRRELVDVALVDVRQATDETWHVAALAREFPSAPFFGLMPYRSADAPAVARCAAHEFADILAEGIDDAVLRDAALQQGFTARFARALAVPPRELNLGTEFQRGAWGAIVAHGGRPVQTAELARAVGLTREHLSRRFATGGAPNLKRVVDLVRLIAAAELAKNPGYDVADIATVLKFASPSHLATATQRIAGVRPSSLARLRGIDLVRRFAQGRGRSRGQSSE
jgi:AraC-like DNA-binding protein